MPETSQPFKIVHCDDPARVLFVGKGCTVREALREAVAARADLTGAHLTGAHLTGANLAGANLTGANLAWANLTGAYLTGAPDAEGEPTKDKILSVASVQFTGHGQCGRALLGIATESGAVHLHCGCFHGGPKELRSYIAQEGAEKYVKTRALALKTVLALLKAKNP